MEQPFGLKVQAKKITQYINIISVVAERPPLFTAMARQLNQMPGTKFAFIWTFNNYIH
jgi:hypothetical protein